MQFHKSSLLGIMLLQIVAHWTKHLCDPLLKLSLNHSTSKYAVTTYASILNKQPEGKERKGVQCVCEIIVIISGPELTGWIENHMDSLWSDVSSLKSCGDSFIGPLTVWIWVSLYLWLPSTSHLPFITSLPLALHIFPSPPSLHQLPFINWCR